MLCNDPVYEVTLRFPPKWSMAFLLNHLVDQRRQDDFHGKAHFSARHDDRVRTGHERVMKHIQLKVSGEPSVNAHAFIASKST